MNQEDILKMAEDAGLAYTSDGAAYPAMYDHVEINAPLERFAALVAGKAAQDEREACAQVCEKKSDNWAGLCNDTADALQACAGSLRARGR